MRRVLLPAIVAPARSVGAAARAPAAGRLHVKAADGSCGEPVTAVAGTADVDGQLTRSAMARPGSVRHSRARALAAEQHTACCGQ